MAIRIGGRTELIAHLGHPTGSFRGPLIYNPYFASAGLKLISPTSVQWSRKISDEPDLYTRIWTTGPATKSFGYHCPIVVGTTSGIACVCDQRPETMSSGALPSARRHR
jgi:hypothetical protein